MTDLPTLLRLAEAATPGPWFYDGYSGVFTEDPTIQANDAALDARVMAGENPPDRDPVWLAAETRVCSVPAAYGDTAIGRQQADAQWIAAASPAVVSALCKRLMAAEEALERITTGLSPEYSSEIATAALSPSDGQVGR